MTHRKDPNRLHLRKCRILGSTTYYIVYRQRKIGQVESLPLVTRDGLIQPPILLNRPFSEFLIDRIRDLVNKRDGTNRNIVVKAAPRPDHPAIKKYMLQRILRW